MQETLSRPFSYKAVHHPGIGSMVYTIVYEDHTVYINDTRYAYIDIASIHRLSSIDSLLYDLELAGYYPVILYPELSDALLTHDTPFYRLVRKGCLGMISASSLLGRNPGKAQVIAYNMARGNLAHFIGSERDEMREDDIKAAYAKVESKIGSEAAETLRSNRERVSADDHVEVDLPVKMDYMKRPKRRFFSQ
ncbi:CpsB/CapC family capsule biosynthesis tyrosine phosphatase [Sinobaca qinghaiensis]|uniref:CpsB/CapC family capsule biosynthesis tyrosine phosphatase n=1 Tax=Sinobaca qinghaiensis TaxID=342944 RepID=UPI000E76A219|nr:CpsB/CapC family capsule biosynthesis tyrosine phosphatase [Sinobaca qinghaiensis]